MCLRTHDILKHVLNGKFFFSTLYLGGCNSKIPSCVIIASLVRFFNWAVQINGKINRYICQKLQNLKLIRTPKVTFWMISSISFLSLDAFSLTHIINVVL